MKSAALAFFQKYLPAIARAIPKPEATKAAPPTPAQLKQAERTKENAAASAIWNVALGNRQAKRHAARWNASAERCDNAVDAALQAKQRIYQDLLSNGLKQERAEELVLMSRAARRREMTKEERPLVTWSQILEYAMRHRHAAKA